MFTAKHAESEERWVASTDVLDDVDEEAVRILGVFDLAYFKEEVLVQSVSPVGP